MRFPPLPLLTFFLFCLAACGGPAATSVHPTGPGDPTQVDELAQATPLTPGVHRGALASGHPALAQGQRFALYRLELSPARRVQIRMRSAQVDPLLELTGPGGFRAANDDAFPGTLDAILELVPEVAGTYLLRVSTAVAGQLGAFELDVREEEPVGRGDALALGVAQDGSLGAPNVPGMPGRWLHFHADAGTIFHVRVTSTAFDTVATVIAPDGQRWTNDDANDLGPDGTERGLDSTVTFAAPRDGVYQLVVTAFGGQGMGPFRVRSRLRPPPRLGADGSRPDGLAGPEGGGRVLGLFAGITEYGARGNLYGCADDARLLAEAFMGSHLQQKSDHVLLTDAQVTRDAFLGGARTLVAQARPEDVVVIFYSGHGGQVARTPTSLGELDAFDETLILSDGAVRDDELSEALAGLRAGTLIVALDSCNSGGFARDLIDRPGRMGLFSSDEDVLSDTAEPRQAGGYLSWYLRRGVLGEADARPSDGVLMAGELSDYLYDGFVRDHTLMNPEGSSDPAQRLIVERGSLAWGHVLWAYPRSATGQRIRLPDLALTSLPPR
ncbi:MAG: caspase family protein [Sandaracinaceae bacterium]|nr:caspase family protein [Sandaracinaceae bacterium]